MWNALDLFGRLSLIGSVITICGFLFWLVRGAPKLAGFLGRLFKKESVYYDIPKRTMLLAHVRFDRCVWQMGARANHPVMLMMGEAIVTNATKESSGSLESSSDDHSLKDRYG